MATNIRIEKMGKLKIYLKTGDAIDSSKFLKKLFPESKYRKILEEARKEGILNAHIYHTHSATDRGSKVKNYNIEGDNSGLTVCLELIDKKEKLEQFFETHKSMFHNKTVIYKEVEFWSI